VLNNHKYFRQSRGTGNTKESPLGRRKINVLTLKYFNIFAVSEAASTNMKACWLFIGEWALVGIAAANFQALLC